MSKILSDSITRKFIATNKIDGYEIWTDTGWRSISSISKTVPYEVWHIKLENGFELKCADTHILFDENYNEIYCKDCIVNVTRILTENGPQTVVSIENLQFEENMYDLEVDSEDHRFYSNKILSHNSITTVSYFLWIIIFNEYQSLAILANKEDRAKDMIARMQLAYEHLPKWMQQGVVEWNKKSFELENGCKVTAAATSSTSARGGSHSCFTANNKVTISNKKTGVIEEVSFDDLKQKLGTVLENSDRYEILTDEGFVDFYGLQILHANKFLQLKTKSFILECTPDHKLFFGYALNDKKAAIEYSVDDLIVTQNGFEKIISITSIERDVEEVYDVLNVDNSKHSFYVNNFLVTNCIFLDEFSFVAPNLQSDFFSSVIPTISSGKTTKIFICSTPSGMDLFYKLWTEAVEGTNGFFPLRVHWTEDPSKNEEWKRDQLAILGEEGFRREYEIEFIGSTNTLISAKKLRELAYKKPLYERDNLKVYERPVENHAYIITVDTSHGVELDFSVFSVFDVSEMPYKQVAVYRSNTIPPLLYPTIIARIATEYNEAYVLIETNDVGVQVADILFREIEYENVVMTKASGRNGITVSGGFSAQTVLGIRQTKTTKNRGNWNAKSLIEENKLLIVDFDTIAELMNYVVNNKQSYSAAEGHHDDCVMTLVLFAWLADSEYFKDLTNLDMRVKLYEAKMRSIDEDVLPFGIIDSDFIENSLFGKIIPDFSDDGDVYTEV